MGQLLQFKNAPNRQSSIVFYSSLVSTIILGVIGGNYLFDHQTAIVEKYKQVSKKTIKYATSCNIKGNVSINTGERIFHVPGQEFYSRTIITPRYGERWFCSEEAAYKAGWRKARH